MKKTLSFIVIALFLANTIIVSAWAKSCLHDAEMTTITSETVVMDEMPDCHQIEELQPTNSKHCDNLCFCAHVSTVPTLFMKDHDRSGLHIPVNQLFFTDNDALVSVNQIPYKRPPKNIA